MPQQDHQAVLIALDRAAADHLAWLKRVHAALLFHDSRRPLPPELPCLINAWAQAPEVSPAVAEERSEALARLKLARHGMTQRAAALTDEASRGERPAPEDYEAFMAAVEQYGLALRAIETLLRQTLAETDPLTGVSNRLGMMRDLEREAQRAARTGQPCCIAILDLDHFKAINDTFGHPAGDRVLSVAARFFVRRLRPYDRVYRFGGEEFLFCLPDTELAMAERVLNRLRGLMARVSLPLGDGRYARVTASIGLAVLGRGPKALQTAIAQADAAVYAAKAAGRNRVCVACAERPRVLERPHANEPAQIGLS